LPLVSWCLTDVPVMYAVVNVVLVHESSLHAMAQLRGGLECGVCTIWGHREEEWVRRVRSVLYPRVRALHICCGLCYLPTYVDYVHKQGTHSYPCRERAPGTPIVLDTPALPTGPPAFMSTAMKPSTSSSEMELVTITITTDEEMVDSPPPFQPNLVQSDEESN